MSLNIDPENKYKIIRNCTVMNETFPKCFVPVVPVLNLVSKKAIFGKLKALSTRGYMSRAARCPLARLFNFLHFVAWPLHA